MNRNNQLKEWWQKVYQRAKGERYAWGGPDWSATKRLLELGLAADEIAERAARYFDNPIWTKFGNHSFPVFVKNINNTGPRRTSTLRKVYYRCGCGFRGTYSEMQQHADYCQQLAQVEDRAAAASDDPETIRQLIDESLRTK